MTSTSLFHGGAVTVTLAISPDGTVRLKDPSAPSESFRERSSSERSTRAPQRAIQFDPDYGKREGYQDDFLGGNYPRVLLPSLQPAQEVLAARLIGQPNEYELKYHNYSVVMHAKRRLAFFSAANLTAGDRFKLSRPGDEWRTDPRIDADAQLGNFYYKNNKFDRGHLTRREDLEFGKTPQEALFSAADTLHWTNCVPQQEDFNQKPAHWHGLEIFILEEGIYQSQLNVQVFTGPIFEEDDPVYGRFPKIQYPVRFWKVVVAPLVNGSLSATAYILDQSNPIREGGIETEVPFGPYLDFQVPIREIEELTQLKFNTIDLKNNTISLSNYDPLAKPRITRRRAVRIEERTDGRTWPTHYLPLSTLDDIILE